MSEARLKDALMAKLKAVYPTAFFFRCAASRGAIAGLPDILGCVDGLFVGIEAKRPGKYANPLYGCSPAQMSVGNRIQAAGGYWVATDSVDHALTTLAIALAARASARSNAAPPRVPPLPGPRTPL